jgi:hypothetical protein
MKFQSNPGKILDRLLTYHRQALPIAAFTASLSASESCRNLGSSGKHVALPAFCRERSPNVKLGGKIKHDLADAERYVSANRRMPSARFWTNNRNSDAIAGHNRLTWVHVSSECSIAGSSDSRGKRHLAILT